MSDSEPDAAPDTEGRWGTDALDFEEKLNRRGAELVALERGQLAGDNGPFAVRCRRTGLYLGDKSEGRPKGFNAPLWAWSAFNQGGYSWVQGPAPDTEGREVRHALSWLVGDESDPAGTTQLHKMVTGAIRSAADAHGEGRPGWIGSAAKRVVGDVKGELQERLGSPAEREGRKRGLSNPHPGRVAHPEEAGGEDEAWSRPRSWTTERLADWVARKAPHMTGGSLLQEGLMAAADRLRGAPEGAGEGYVDSESIWFYLGAWHRSIDYGSPGSPPPLPDGGADDWVKGWTDADQVRIDEGRGELERYGASCLAAVKRLRTGREGRDE